MFIAVRTGLEPVTPCVTGMYSNQTHHFVFLSLLSLSIAVAKVQLFFKPAIHFPVFFHFFFILGEKGENFS